MSSAVTLKQLVKKLAVTTSPCKRSMPNESAAGTGKLPAAMSETRVEEGNESTGALKVDEPEAGGVDTNGCVPV